MQINIQGFIEELEKIDKHQKDAIKSKDNFKLAACFLKLAHLFRENAEFLEQNGQLIISSNFNTLLK